ncbi:hypothetical protein O181_067832 [Austropuccinia psidii MF-1]|uniref:Uncharacterized protein n=1 Tax=Austropuccinia psidii MF-1 TaxID=1389203 RepID=A0A9Q3I5P9_9BASI|nr:hypothetical protein [Austropuccinia psidii MF-1]
MSSSEEAHGPIKDRRPSEGLDTHNLQSTSPTDKRLVEKPNYFFRGPEEGVSPVEAPQASTSKNNPQKVQENCEKAPKSNQKGRQNAKSK